ncbi:MAG: SCO family protein [Proteobacteria bacterium]|nr:SCO family protein [Pseudomonadota bacterium]
MIAQPPIRPLQSSLPLRRARSSAPTLMLAFCAFVALMASVSGARAWHSTDMTGALPKLDFTMTRASDGQQVGADAFKGKVVILFFGYTSCPDICPTTLMNATTMLKTLGPGADDVRFLFVTVDPKRDTLKALKDYTGSFAPQIVGLRGTADQLATLAKRYRVAYSVTPAGDGHGYEVTHSTAAYVFNRNGDIKLLFTDLAAPNAKLDGMTADLRQMVAGGGAVSWWQRVWNML